MELPSIPEAVSSLTSLQFYARQAVDGTLSGLHRSNLFGSSIEFAEHREYSPGDDLRHMDWKVLGRSDKYYLKRFEDETNSRAYLVLDASASMNFGSVGYSKSAYSIVLTATIGYLFLSQQDLVALVRFGEGEPLYVPPRDRMTHFHVLTDLLVATEARGQQKLPEALRFLGERIHRRGVVFVLSDFLSSLDDLESMARVYETGKHDVYWIQILDPAEMDFPYEDRLSFRGLEGEPDLDVEARQAKRSYQRELGAWLEQIKDVALKHGIHYRRVRTDEAPNGVLASLTR